jgi:hypothetical protein
MLVGDGFAVESRATGLWLPESMGAKASLQCFGVGSVNGDQGGHKGSARARLPLHAAHVSFADRNARRQTLVSAGFCPGSKVFPRAHGAFVGPAGEWGMRFVCHLERGVQ